MARKPGHVDVVTEVGYCNFCNRTRNLRREEHHLGGLVRTIVSCETCHRTLSSSMGVATQEPEPKAAAQPEPEEVEAPKPAPAKTPAAKTPAAKKPAAKKPAAKKPTDTAKTPSRPRSTSTRKSTRTK